MKLILMPLAVTDTEGIYTFSFQQFGIDKARDYLNQLEEQIQQLIKNPLQGMDYSFIDKNLRRLVVARHSVFYGIVEDRIEIYRVLHQSRDVTRFL